MRNSGKIHPPSRSSIGGVADAPVAARSGLNTAKEDSLKLAQAGHEVGSYRPELIVPGPNLLDKVVNNGLGTAAGLAGATMMVPFVGQIANGGIGAVGKVTRSTKIQGFAGKLGAGLDRVNGFSNAELVGKISPKHGAKLQGSKWGDLGAIHTVAHAGFAATSAVGMYNVARDLSSQLDSMRQMEADLTGKDPSTISNATLMTGAVSKPVAEERKRLMKTDGVHTLAHAAGMGVNLAFLKNPNAFGHSKFGMIAGMVAYMAPDMIANTVDAMVGESVVGIYKGMSDAQKSGTKLEPQAYAEFLLLAADSLKNRGKTGADFATALGAQYANENKSVSEVLKEVHSGAMQTRIDAIVASAPKSHVEKLQGAKAAIAQPVVGAHTKKLAQTAAAAPEGPTLH